MLPQDNEQSFWMWLSQFALLGGLRVSARGDVRARGLDPGRDHGLPAARRADEPQPPVRAVGILRFGWCVSFFCVLSVLLCLGRVGWCFGRVGRAAMYAFGTVQIHYLALTHSRTLLIIG